ncbi:MAG: dihydroorotate dehydrogenase [Candidatus Omnitrophica bacterium]|nr:dihydroorotate dehydrogenase [Candidatus Omnitrophota bacterium]
MKINLEIKLGRLTLDTPIISASGTFGYGDELRGLANFKSIGAITTKTITLKPRAGNPPPRIYESECGVINSVGLENPGLGVFVNEKLPEIRKLNTKCIVSVGGFSNKEYQDLVGALTEEKGVDGLEINLSCPNLKLKKLISQDVKATYNLTRALRKITKKPLFIKITPEVTDIVKIAKAVEQAGADSIALVNTFFSLRINIETGKPYLGNVYGGYSGKAIKPMSLYRVWKVAKEVKIPIIGGGGIENASDAIEFILAGARAVSLGTINLVNPNSAEDVLSGIKKYMEKKKVSDINKLRGGLIE